MIRDNAYAQLLDQVAQRFVSWYPVDARPQRPHAWACLAAQDRLVNLFIQTANDDDVAAVVLRIGELRDGLKWADKQLEEWARGRPW